jgi:hypothetical protein
MAELVDALDSKSGFGNGVQVRFLFWAQKNRGFAFFLLLIRSNSFLTTFSKLNYGGIFPYEARAALA